MLQALASLSQRGPVLYVTGEESAEQVALRAQRLGVSGDGVDLLPEDRSAAAQFVASVSEEDLLRMVDSLSRSELDFRKSIDPDPRLSIEMALLKAAQLRRLGRCERPTQVPRAHRARAWLSSDPHSSSH